MQRKPPNDNDELTFIKPLSFYSIDAMLPYMVELMDNLIDKILVRKTWNSYPTIYHWYLRFHVNK